MQQYYFYEEIKNSLPEENEYGIDIEKIFD